METRLRCFLDGNISSTEDIPIMVGGIRKYLFEINPILTKVSLFKFGSSVEPFTKSSHKLEGGHIADISCILLHMLLNCYLKEKSTKCISSGGYYNNSYNYKQIYKEFRNKPIITPSQAKKYVSINKLIEDNFINVSDKYLAYIKENRNK